MKDTGDISNVQPEKKRLTLFGVEVVYLYILGIFLAGLGWIAENVVQLITHGIISSKFHILPFISAYALIVFAVQIFLGDPDDIAIFGKHIFKEQNRKTVILSNVLSLLFACFFVFISELIVGNLWYELFGVALWSYSGWVGEFTQFTSLPSTLGFGIAAYLGFRFLYKPALSLVRKKLNYRVAKIICLTLGVAIILDTAFMIVQLGINGEAPVYWTINFN